MKLNTKNPTNNQILKMGKGPEKTFLQRGYIDGQQTYEKMLTNHQIYAYQNHNKIPSH